MSTKRVEDTELPWNYEEANYSSEEETVQRLEEVDRTGTVWPGVRNNSRTGHIRKVSSGGDQWVELIMGRSQMRLYTHGKQIYHHHTCTVQEVHGGMELVRDGENIRGQERESET